MICPCCGAVLPGNKKNPRVQTQLAAQRGGADVEFDAKGHRTGGARLLAIVLLKPGQAGRHYRLPTERDYEAVRRAHVRIAKVLEEWERSGRQGLLSGAGRATTADWHARFPRTAVRHAQVGRHLHS